jgi:hypothetical protein
VWSLGALTAFPAIERLLDQEADGTDGWTTCVCKNFTAGLLNPFIPILLAHVHERDAGLIALFGCLTIFEEVMNDLFGLGTDRFSPLEELLNIPS